MAPTVNFVRETFGRKYTSALAPGRDVGVRVFLVSLTEPVRDLKGVVELALLPPLGTLPAWKSAFSIATPDLQLMRHEPAEIGKEKTLYTIACHYEDVSATPVVWQCNWSTTSVDWVVTKNLEGLSYADDIPDSAEDEFFGNIWLFRKEALSIQGQEIVNAAFDEYNPAFTRQLVMPEISLTKRFTGLADSDFPYPQDILQVVDTCNDEPIKIAGMFGRRWQWKILGVSISPILDEYGSRSYDVTVKIGWHPYLWLVYAPNAGYNRLATGGERVRIVGEDNTPVTQPVALTETGGVIPPESVPTTKQFYAWAVHNLSDFTVFDFPAELPYTF